MPASQAGRRGFESRLPLHVFIDLRAIWDTSPLKPLSPVEREAALARTFGCLSLDEADELKRIIEEGCEQINERAW